MRTPALVLDNSTVIAWALGEGHPGADAVMDLLVDGEARVPSLWPLEFANVLLVAERRKRLTGADAVRVREMVLSLPVTVVPDDPARIFSTVLALAREQDLSVYEAAYLDLAMREKACRSPPWIGDCATRRDDAACRSSWRSRSGPSRPEGRNGRIRAPVPRLPRGRVEGPNEIIVLLVEVLRSSPSTRSRGRRRPNPYIPDITARRPDRGFIPA